MLVFCDATLSRKDSLKNTARGLYFVFIFTPRSFCRIYHFSRLSFFPVPLPLPLLFHSPPSPLHFTTPLSPPFFPLPFSPPLFFSSSPQCVVLRVSSFQYHLSWRPTERASSPWHCMGRGEKRGEKRREQEERKKEEKDRAWERRD